LKESSLSFVIEGFAVRLKVFIGRIDGKALETCAAGKGAHIDVRDGGRDGDPRELRATVKGAVADECERRRERNADKVGALLESILANALHWQVFVDFGNEDIRAGAGIAVNFIA